MTLTSRFYTRGQKRKSKMQETKSPCCSRCYFSRGFPWLVGPLLNWSEQAYSLARTGLKMWKGALWDFWLGS